MFPCLEAASCGRHFYRLPRRDKINPSVGQRRRLGGLGAGLGEDTVDRALADLEGGGNLGPGAAGRGELDHLRRLGPGVRPLSLVLALALARVIPSRWRSSMISRSSWAIAAMTVRIMRLIAPAILPLERFPIR